MKIVLFANSFLPQIGGRELVVHHLARALTELGHQARVVGPGGWWTFRNLRYVNIRCIAFRAASLERVRIAVQCCKPVAMSYMPILPYPAKRLRRVPLVINGS